MKKRILWCGEASYLNTGYSTYAIEVLGRLYDTGKYEIAELASYADPDDPRLAQCPWHIFPVYPSRSNRSDCEAYSANPTWQFGEWKFEEACLKFRPDAVLDVRDWWMLEFQERSPFRPFYRWGIMPTVDAEPQDDQWLATYMSADGVFTYSDWGMDLLKRQTGGRINAVDTASPGADFDVFKPVPDRKAFQRAAGLPDDCLVVGTVMRNQRRKLYPDLIRAFGQFLREAPKDVSSRAYLYMHTSYPDSGWDLPRLILEEGVASKCLMTYSCRSCGASFPLPYSDAVTMCRKCGEPTAGLPTTHNGLSREGLAQIINLFDVYVQYANSEGFGMPQVEAAACGVPVMSVDYSAMSDVVRKLGGHPIKVKSLVREPETHCWRASPDGDDLVRALIAFFGLPGVVREQRGRAARKAAQKYYTYDIAAAKWDRWLETLERPRMDWGAPSRAKQPPKAAPGGLSNEEFVRWGITNIAGRPDLLNSYTALRMVRDLNWGMTTGGTGGVYFNEMSISGTQMRHGPFDRNMAVSELLKLNAQLNHWEARRTAK